MPTSTGAFTTRSLQLLDRNKTYFINWWRSINWSYTRKLKFAEHNKLSLSLYYVIRQVASVRKYPNYNWEIQIRSVLNPTCTWNVVWFWYDQILAYRRLFPVCTKSTNSCIYRYYFPGFLSLSLFYFFSNEINMLVVWNINVCWRKTLNWLPYTPRPRKQSC